MAHLLEVVTTMSRQMEAILLLREMIPQEETIVQPEAATTLLLEVTTILPVEETTLLLEVTTIHRLEETTLLLEVTTILPVEETTLLLEVTTILPVEETTLLLEVTTIHRLEETTLLLEVTTIHRLEETTLLLEVTTIHRLEETTLLLEVTTIHRLTLLLGAVLTPREETTLRLGMVTIRQLEVVMMQKTRTNKIMEPITIVIVARIRVRVEKEGLRLTVKLIQGLHLPMELIREVLGPIPMELIQPATKLVRIPALEVITNKTPTKGILLPLILTQLMSVQRIGPTRGPTRLNSTVAIWMSPSPSRFLLKVMS